ncbi:MAG: L-glutamate gamma-semialdehyde dehydrogenase [Gemmatales bacterium]|nr:L-glutamate gamma-semialdehyde dehydrogenase [Gemmatales bacterium]MDW8387739.1 L-glutamate gamma-semialdehyde dehydrogenase [Gemmatales bacterium]
MSQAALEALTQQYGRELFARMETARPPLFFPKWWEERLMGFTMDREALKVQLFRFVDVLPQLREPEQITRHLREYLREAGGTDGMPIPTAAQWLPDNGLLGRLVADAARWGASRMAQRFIAGSNLQEALDALARLRKARMAFTVDLLGEAVLTEAEAQQYQNQYFALLDGLAATVNAWPEVDLIDRDHQGPLPRVNVSLKLSSLYSQFDPIAPDHVAAVVRDRLRPILSKARSLGAFVNIDMEQYAYKDLTLRIFKEIACEAEFRDWPDLGIAIQAYLRNCRKDLELLAEWVRRRGTPIWVRLVKGAYWDYEVILAAQHGWPIPVFTRKHHSDANYEACLQFLMERPECFRVAVGSHNVRSIARALALAEHLGRDPRSIEFQLLYGMADETKAALVRLGRRVRVYTPYGQLLPGMAYLVRRLLENTANQSFLRAAAVEHVSEEQLLQDPSLAEEPPQGADMVATVSPPRVADHEPVSAVPPFSNCPVADFSREENRQAMREALRKVAGQLGQYFPLVINGQPIRTTKQIKSVNPANRLQTVGTTACAEPEHAEKALATAVKAFPKWRDTPPEERAECLFRTAAILRERRWELAAWEVFECGKQWQEADADVAEAVDFCEYYGREMLRLAQPRRRNVLGEYNAYFYEPRGPAVVIAPWNFPLAILCGMTTAALVTGNPTIMKPAEQSSVIAALFHRILLEAGVPPDVVSYLPGKGEEVGPTLVTSKDTAIIAFTGSKAVGLLLNRQAAETPPGQDHVKKIICEMGGKNAIIVDDDADLDEAVHGVVVSAFGYQGQKCSACSRAIVLERIHDQFLERLIEATKSLRIGPAEDPSYAIGPVIDEEARQRILWYIEKGKTEARLAFAADVGTLADAGFYVGPHIFVDVPPTATIAQEEIFGPVLAVMKARDLDHALEIAEGTPYALTGGLYSRSPEHIAQVRRRFRVGNLYINRKITGALVDRQPFGGFKLSGIGSKAGGPDYLLQFLNPRVVTENTLRRGYAPLEGHARKHG